MLKTMLSWLMLSCNTELSYFPNGNFLLYNPNGSSLIQGEYYELQHNPAHADIGFEASMKYLYVSAGVKTGVYLNDISNPSQHLSIYNFACGLRFSVFEFGYRHDCGHPAIPVQFAEAQQIRNSKPFQQWEYAYDQIYMSAKFSYKPFNN